jgi:hypothetical protein
MRHSSRLVLWAVLAAPAAAAPAVPPDTEPLRSVLLLPGGVADLAGRTGFVANASGGIDAIDLVTGELLWQTAEAQRPLVAGGDRLFAHTVGKDNQLRVLACDVTRRGAVLLKSPPLTLPDWVVPCDGPGRSFTTHCCLEKDHLVLLWEAKSWPTGVKTGERRQATGACRIAVTNGQVQQLEPPAAGPHPPPELDKLTSRWQGRSADQFKAVVLEEEGLQQKLLLRTWDSAGNPVGSPRELLRGQRLLVLPTVDERFLCIRDASSSPDTRSSEDDRLRFGWTVVSVATGEAVERAPFVPGTQAIALQAPRLYVLVSGPVRGPIDRPFVPPRLLQAIDLKTGKRIWERPVEGKQLLPPDP